MVKSPQKSWMAAWTLTLPLFVGVQDKSSSKTFSSFFLTEELFRDMETDYGRCFRIAGP